MDVATGANREVARCAVACPVAWTPDGRSLITVAQSGLARIDASSGSTRAVRTPPGWQVTALDVNPQGRLVLAGTVGAQAGLMGVDLDGGHPAVVRLFGASAWVTEPRWSPDGRTIAYVHRAGAIGNQDVSAALSLRTVSADGSQARTVVGLGTCACGGGWPGLDWSPGGQIAVIGMPRDASITVYLATLDGTLTATSGGNGALAWRPGS